jgi:PKD repeat protein
MAYTRRGRLASGILGVLMAATTLTIVDTAPVGAAATEVVADWRMNEGAGASTMHDSGPHGIDGAIGDAVQTGVSFGGATAYRWSYTPPNTPPAQPERLVQVDDARLNPGTDDYAVTVRFRTTRNFGNIIQKGQSGNPGGLFKWQIPSGKLMCLFRGVDANGNTVQKAVNSGTNLLNDGEWHTVRCERSGDRVTMTIDGTITRRGTGPTGRISNNVPLTIGGKRTCDQITITCDYFVGDIDFVRIDSSPRTQSPVADAAADCTGLRCDFDGTGSHDPDGNIVAYSWDFGDGVTGNGALPSHVYDTPGTYQARLTVTDNDGATDDATLNVTVASAPPQGAFGFECDYLECSFDAAASDDPDGWIVNYGWDFDDGSGGGGVSPRHDFAGSGTYRVRLTVTDNHGVTGDATANVTVTEPPEVHIAALVPKPKDRPGKKWVARVLVKIRDGDHDGVAGVDVKARYGARKRRVCTTNEKGNCWVKVNVRDRRARIPLRILDVDWVGGYDASANRDPDHDGNGERVMVRRP